MKYSSGDLLELEYENSKIKCHLIEDKEDVYVLKLDSGYNIGVAKNKVKNIELIAKLAKKKVKR